MDYELGQENLQRLVTEVQQENRNEATTRLQIIDRLLFDCLGWDRTDCISEERYDGQYADYTYTKQRRMVIVEAKREGDYFELPVGTNKREYFLKTLCHDHPSLSKAIKQVTEYCQSRGVPLGVVCNGHQIVACLATRSDGIAPLEGHAIVFPSLEEMENNFRLLWNSLSND